MRLLAKPKSRALTVVAVAASGVLLAGGLAVAAKAPNVYTGCLTTDGAMIKIKIGDSPLRPCRTLKGQRQISWNETGPQGEQGIQGEQGPQGIRGEQGPQGTPGRDGAGFIGGSVLTDAVGPKLAFGDPTFGETLRVYGFADRAECALELTNNTGKDVQVWEEINDSTNGSSFASYKLIASLFKTFPRSSSIHYRFRVVGTFGNVTLDYWMTRSLTHPGTCNYSYQYTVN